MSSMNFATCQIGPGRCVLAAGRMFDTPVYETCLVLVMSGSVKPTLCAPKPQKSSSTSSYKTIYKSKNACVALKVSYHIGQRLYLACVRLRHHHLSSF